MINSNNKKKKMERIETTDKWLDFIVKKQPQIISVRHWLEVAFWSSIGVTLTLFTFLQTKQKRVDTFKPLKQVSLFR